VSASARESGRGGAALTLTFAAAMNCSSVQPSMAASPYFLRSSMQRKSIAASLFLHSFEMASLRAGLSTILKTRTWSTMSGLGNSRICTTRVTRSSAVMRSTSASASSLFLAFLLHLSLNSGSKTLAARLVRSASVPGISVWCLPISCASFQRRRRSAAGSLRAQLSASLYLALSLEWRW
jgi:hypothetical protein